MIFIIDEHQTVITTFVVEADSRREAEAKIKRSEDTEQVTVSPEYVETIKRDIRKISDTDLKDYMVTRAVRFLNSAENEPEPPKRRGRPKGSKNKPK
jgi:hypothetical protein